jgi:hypothetical protein
MRDSTVTGTTMDIAVICGLTQRTGTNYIQDLLCLHPECAKSRIPEDYFLYGASNLTAFVEAVEQRWNPRWGLSGADVWSAIGRGLCVLMDEGHRPVGQAQASESARYVVAKTPSTVGIRQMPRLFPAGRLIIVIRDGRDVVESAMRSFDRSLELATAEWVSSARRVRAFTDEVGATFPMMILRYEDAVHDCSGVVRRLCSFLKIDPQTYNFEAATSLEVRGSCETRRSPDSRVHWRPVPPERGFSPVGRWKGWPTDQLQRFWDMAGAEMEALGYSS